MALILADDALHWPAGTYLRIDGIRFEPVARRRADGVWSIDPDTPVAFHLYAYRSATARTAGSAPVGDRAWRGTLAPLGVLEMAKGTANLKLGPAWRLREMDTDTLWQSLYGQVRHEFPGAIDDHRQRSPDCR